MYSDIWQWTAFLSHPANIAWPRTTEVIIFNYAINSFQIREITHKCTLCYKLLLCQLKNTVPNLHAKQKSRNTQRSLRTSILLQLCWLASKLHQITMVIALVFMDERMRLIWPHLLYFQCRPFVLQQQFINREKFCHIKGNFDKSNLQEWIQQVSAAKLFTNNKLNMGIFM